MNLTGSSRPSRSGAWISVYLPSSAHGHMPADGILGSKLDCFLLVENFAAVILISSPRAALRAAIVQEQGALNE